MKFRRATLSEDLIAGLTFALVNIPQSMAHALLAAVNPVFGLYTLMLAAPVGAIFTSSVFMNISTTSALAVAAGDTLIAYPTDTRGSVLVTLVLIIGVFQVVVGLLRLGWITRFFSFPVQPVGYHGYDGQRGVCLVWVYVHIFMFFAIITRVHTQIV